MVLDIPNFGLKGDMWSIHVQLNLFNLTICTVLITLVLRPPEYKDNFLAKLLSQIIHMRNKITSRMVYNSFVAGLNSGLKSLEILKPKVLT